MSSKEIEYRLSYLQTLLNPAGGVLPLALGVVTGVGGFLSMREAATHSGFGFLSAGLYATSVLLFFYRSPRRRSRRTITFMKDGVAFDLADCVIGDERETVQHGAPVPYRLLSVHRGLGGVTVLKTLSGHFVLVPKSAISRETLTRLIEAGKEGKTASSVGSTGGGQI